MQALDHDHVYPEKSIAYLHTRGDDSGRIDSEWLAARGFLSPSDYQAWFEDFAFYYRHMRNHVARTAIYVAELEARRMWCSVSSAAAAAASVDTLVTTEDQLRRWWRHSISSKDRKRIINACDRPRCVYCKSVAWTTCRYCDNVHFCSAVCRGLDRHEKFCSLAFHVTK